MSKENECPECLGRGWYSESDRHGMQIQVQWEYCCGRGELQDAPTSNPNPDEWELNGVKGRWPLGIKFIAADKSGAILGYYREPHISEFIDDFWVMKRTDPPAIKLGKGPAILDDSWKTMILKRPEGV